MHLDRGIIKIGMEIEVAAWQSGWGYYETAKALVKAGYMQEPAEQWSETHQYHCNCKAGGCDNIRLGYVISPPLVSMTYDASLPPLGAEFIISPVLLADDGLEMLSEIWDIITDHAVWSNSLADYHETGHCSPSVHLHVSANKTTEIDYADGSSVKYFVDDILHSLSLFSPELFSLASLVDVQRGLKFRLPNRFSIEKDQEVGAHHGFVHVRKARPNEVVYIEWRLFEAAYNDWSYIQSCAYIAAVLTRAFLDRDNVSRLLGEGSLNPYDDNKMSSAASIDSTGGVLALVDPARIAVLREVCVSQIDDDQQGFEMINNMFDRLESSLGL